MAINGPLYRIYRGMDGRPDTLFTLEIAIPVRRAFRSQQFNIKELDPFRAITFPHEGPWEQLPGSHALIMEQLSRHHIPITNEYREVFLNIDVNEPANHITEIQIGVAMEKALKPLPSKKLVLPVYM